MISELRKRLHNEDKHVNYSEVFGPEYAKQFEVFKTSKDMVMTEADIYKGSTADAVREVLGMTKGFGPAK